jgi:phenylalanyl-tRNA synthetase beta chain
MKVLLSWLRDFAPFGDDLDELTRAFGFIGLPVEEMTVMGEPIPGVITARVLALKPHPQADRIQLVDVDTGNGEALQICCGAFNMSVGDTVPLASLGTVMPGGMEIARRKLRGEWSNGMLCSSRELGLDDEHGGIKILPSTLPLGVDVFSALGIEHDVLFDLDVTRNRPDCFGHVGVARELAAYLSLPFTAPAETVAAVGPSPRLTVRIEAPDVCGRFTARRMTGVVITDSPKWIADRLTRAGMRPINNVVDASNYVMLELNRPTHAYDAAKVPGDGFVIRHARDGETMVTLDQVRRALSTADCLICDAESTPVGIAGIMGSASSEVDATTSEVLFEQAWFAPEPTAASARRLGLRSEAGYRFERGCDPFDDAIGASRFVELLSETCPDIAMYDVVADTGQLPVFADIDVRVARASLVLGRPLTGEHIIELLAPLGYVPRVSSSETVTISVPSRRLDLLTEIDVIEEIGRRSDFSTIVPVAAVSPLAGGLTTSQATRRRIKDVLVGAGGNEVYPSPFLAPVDIERIGWAAPVVELANPLVGEESVLRPTLLAGLLKVVALNANHRRTAVSLFEVGHVVHRSARELPDEHDVVAAALAGREAPEAVALLDEVCAALSISPPTLIAAQLNGLHPTRCAIVRLNGADIGVVGEVDPSVLVAHGITERVAWFEVSFEPLVSAMPTAHLYEPVKRFPSSDLDLAFVLADDVAASALEAALRTSAGSLLVWLRLFDVYRGSGVAEHSRSLAYTLRLQAPDRTLTEGELADVRTALIAAGQSVGAVLRA